MVRVNPTTRVDFPWITGIIRQTMADDIFHGKSRAGLKKEIEQMVLKDERSLPIKAKVFAAVARLQKFDMLPEVASPAELTAHAAAGATELQRGLSSSGGVAAKLYASELVRGPLFPGVLTAFGQGIYLATTSHDLPRHAAFPRMSHVAHEYAKKSAPGMIVRCILKPKANVQDSDDLKQFLRESQNRAKEVFGAVDLGTFAASLGIDGYCCGTVEHAKETTWVILNRTALVFQTIGLQIGAHSSTFKT